MTDKLHVDQHGYLSFRGVALFIRYADNEVIIPIKHPGDRARLGCARLRIPLEEFQKLARRQAESAANVGVEPHSMNKRRARRIAVE